MRENEYLEPAETVNHNREMVRLMLMQYLEAIQDKGIECDIDADEDGNWFLYAPVRGMENRTAFFNLSLDEFEGTITLYATYSSDLLRSPEFAEIILTESSDPEEAADFVADFIWQCFSKEHMKYCAFEHVNEQSLKRYIHFLPDFFFDDKSKDYYAVGICLAETDDIISAGAAVYSIGEDNNLVVDYVMIDENLRGIGLGTYLVNHIVNTAIEENEERGEQ